MRVIVIWPLRRDFLLKTSQRILKVEEEERSVLLEYVGGQKAKIK